MLTRKAELARRADAFVALPGGFGTLEELLEQLTGRLLGFHDKPIVLADVDGFGSRCSTCSSTCTESGSPGPKAETATPSHGLRPT